MTHAVAELSETLSPEIRNLSWEQSNLSTELGIQGGSLLALGDGLARCKQLGLRVQDEVGELRGRGDRVEDSFSLRLATFSELLGRSHLNHVNLEKVVYRSRQDKVDPIDAVGDHHSVSRENDVKVLAGRCDSVAAIGASLTLRINAVEFDLQSLRAGTSIAPL